MKSLNLYNYFGDDQNTLYNQLVTLAGKQKQSLYTYLNNSSIIEQEIEYMKYFVPSTKTYKELEKITGISETVLKSYPIIGEF